MQLSDGQTQEMNGAGVQVSEENLLNLALNETKLMASSLNTYILEASNESMRRDYMTILGDVYSQQKQLFDCMEQKGYYHVVDATPDKIRETKAKFQSPNR